MKRMYTSALMVVTLLAAAPNAQSAEGGVVTYL